MNKFELAHNPNTPLEVLEKLANDEDADIRSYVAENPNTPPEVLEKLAADEHWLVRYWAAKIPAHQNTLKHINAINVI